MDLLRSHEQDPRLLDWLRRTTWRGGSLGLWQQCADRIDSQLLDIVSVLDQSDSGSSPSLSRGIPVSAFPPVEVRAMVEPGTADMVTVLPIRIDDRDWGMLAIVGPPECWELTGREMSNQTAALLTVALNHQALLRTLREQEARLRYSSLHDALTGLPNRVLFSDRLARAVQAAQVDLAHRYAVLFIDLDGFKQVNDTLGHPTGDRLLIHVAQRLQANLRTDDVIARFGGDEFAVLIDSHTDVGVVTAMAANLIAILERPFDIDGAQICISASIGIAHGHDGYQHADEVLRDADTAMYSAKNWGKGRYVVFAPTTCEPAISM